MIGREAVKSPWIFRLAANAISGRAAELRVNVRETFLKTLGYLREYLPERLHKSRSHRFCAYYTQNALYSHDLFTRIRKESAISRIEAIVEDYYLRNEWESERTFRVDGGMVHEVN
jgi:tRNA-dihydrouridine synthase